MKKNNIEKLIGYVTITVYGEDVVFFLQMLTQRNIPIWNLRNIDKQKITGKVYINHIQAINELNSKNDYIIKYKNEKGLAVLLKKTLKKKKMLAGFVLSLFLLLWMSNTIWNVSISGVSTDLEQTLTKKLKGYGLSKGSLVFKVQPIDIIQQELLYDMPELLYIGIKKQGGTYEIIAVEKLIEKEKEILPAQDLIAEKDGIIKKMYVRAGIPVVHTNDHIKKGDLLVSGTYEQLETDNKVKNTAADGEVYANTWYEVSLNGNLQQYKETIIGNSIEKYRLEVGMIDIPIWGFKKQNFTDQHIEVEKKPIYFLKWELPIKLNHIQIYEKEINEEAISMDKFKADAQLFVAKELSLKLGSDAEIINNYILHESTMNGKVKLKLYISVLENIAKSVPIE